MDFTPPATSSEDELLSGHSEDDASIVSDRDADSTLGDVNRLSTMSVLTSVWDSVEVCGRTYHRYHDGSEYVLYCWYMADGKEYLFPDDEEQRFRYEFLHKYWQKSLDGKLHIAPISKFNRVLDLGTGTGQWAVDFADQHGECYVAGIDLSPVQPEWVPPNLEFYVEDIEDCWTFSWKFDFIHGRFLYLAFGNVYKMIQNAYDFLTPGGYLELKDLLLPPLESCSSSVVEDFLRYIVEGCKVLGKDYCGVEKYKEVMEGVGFEDIHTYVLTWPTSTIAEDLYTLARSMRWRLSHSIIGSEETINAAEGRLTNEIPEVQILVIYGRKKVSAS